LRCETAGAFFVAKKGKGDDMNLEDLLEQIICDRIEMLLNARSDETLHEEKELNLKMKNILERLDEESKVAMEQFWDEWVMQSAEENRYLYLAGMKDGARVLKVFLKF
jgi:hypothetical protein